jgi:hypothetical protein
MLDNRKFSQLEIIGSWKFLTAHLLRIFGENLVLANKPIWSLDLWSKVDRNIDWIHRDNQILSCSLHSANILSFVLCEQQIYSAICKYTQFRSSDSALTKPVQKWTSFPFTQWILLIPFSARSKNAEIHSLHLVTTTKNWRAQNDTESFTEHLEDHLFDQLGQRPMKNKFLVSLQFADDKKCSAYLVNPMSFTFQCFKNPT